jgi:hypothetical protein
MAISSKRTSGPGIVSSRPVIIIAKSAGNGSRLRFATTHLFVYAFELIDCRGLMRTFMLVHRKNNAPQN